MGNVEKKLVLDFTSWREERNQNETTKEAIKRDFENFMQARFQIKPSQNASNEPISIINILDMMIAPDVDASIAANSVRENVLACKQSEQETEPLVDSPDPTQPCTDSSFKRQGTKCFYMSHTKMKQANAANFCEGKGAKLAKISDSEENDFVLSLSQQRSEGDGAWIGLNDLEIQGTWVWQDGSTAQEFDNWELHYPTTVPGENCVMMHEATVGTWANVDCNEEQNFVCSMEEGITEETPESSLGLDSEVKNMLQSNTCTSPETNTSAQVATFGLPGIDIFLNPARKQERERIIEEKKNVAKTYFKESNMLSLYPELFRILWESTLPCFKEENKEEHMLLSCELAGKEVNCSDIFTRVPTDSGMCCALNVDDTLRASEYEKLVKEMQGEGTARKVHT